MRAIPTHLPLFGTAALTLAVGLVGQVKTPVAAPLRQLRATSAASSAILAPRSTAVVTPGLDAAVLAAATQDPAVAQPPAPPSPRLAALLQIVFDRRPSTILAAWATPEPAPLEAAPAGAEALPGNVAPAADPEIAPAVEPATQPTGALSPEQIRELIAEELEPPAPPTAGATQPVVSAPTPTAPALSPEQLRLQRELELLQRHVTLGRWHELGAFLEAFPEAERKLAYEHLLRVLPTHPNKPPQRVPPNLQEKNRFAFQDAFALAALAPGGLTKEQVPLLAPIVQRALDEGSVVEEFVRLLGVEVQKVEGERRLDRRRAAQLLAELKLERELGVFLPTATEAEAANDREALNLLARHALAKYDEEKRHVWLETAWRATQAALAEGEVEASAKEEALRRAVELAPKVRADLGPTWLAQSFTERPERGMEIIATIGGQVAKGFQEQAQNARYRAAGLELQKTAVDALLDVAPERAREWQKTLGLLAQGWVVEAVHSYQNSRTTSFGPVMERDDYGNLFWTTRRQGGGGQVAAVEPEDLMKAQPGERWAALLDEALQPHFQTVSAQLWLKVNEYEKAFPYIEQLSATNPRKAKDLAHEFLRVWMENNNPNSARRTNVYMFAFGFNQRANGIPLTRSKQERNLDELASYVERLRQLPIGGVDEKLLGQAFVAAHSVAEVYRLETIERVFGDVAELDPVLLGQLLGTMRSNLATVWQLPAVQEAEKTRRSQREMMAEVARGYEVATSIAEDALQARGRHWSLLGAVATLMHDQNNFGKQQQRSSSFSDVRKAAFELFAEACEHYVSTAGDLRLDQETVEPFTLWFYCALGASDLGAIDEDTVLAKGQLPRIKEALDQLPDGSRERHVAMFANQLFTRMTACRPNIKFRYLQAGFEIVGDHPQAAEAKKVWDYYMDLIRELRLEVVVDGPTAVGTEPFGVRVDIVHTREIERESGGFQKYATNQNNQPGAWNYGRPLENYRDKFHDNVISALSEHFEILSATFNSEQMESFHDDAPGWRRTPYCYLLLQARGPQVDRIPTIQMDFDFLDTSGFAVLPIGTAPVAIDASAASEQRPYEGLEVTQLLDERRLDEGKVTLEIKAKSKGLVPALETFLELETPGFVVEKRDDQGAAVIKFSEDQDTVESERVWLFALAPEQSGSRPGSFRFGRPRGDDVAAVYQRYDDADLETVSAEVALRGPIRGDDPLWAWFVLGAAFVLYVLWFLFVQPSGRGDGSAADELRMPAQITPFSVLALLQQVARRAPLAGPQRDALQADIRRIEAVHFGRGEDPSLDLAGIAAEWLRRAS